MKQFFTFTFVLFLGMSLGNAQAVELTSAEVATFSKVHSPPGLSFTLLEVMQGEVTAVEIPRSGEVYHFGNQITTATVHLSLVGTEIDLNGALAYPTSAISHPTIERRSIPDVADHERSANINGLVSQLRIYRDGSWSHLGQEEITRRAIAYAEGHTFVVAAESMPNGILLTCSGTTALEQRPMQITLFGQTPDPRTPELNARSRFYELAALLASGTPVLIGTEGEILVVSVENTRDLAGARADFAALRAGPQSLDLFFIPERYASEILNPVDLAQHRRE
ncbi:MAG: hypothetical protein QGI43_02390 [Gemmatimonadota bacterium]|jgi:hypothetical protein|nr:hypothetical protein [Gemmatimonadota bacterium]